MFEDRRQKTEDRGQRKIAKRRAQSSIETTVALVIFFMLFVAAVKVFVYFNERLVVRQRVYDDSRVAAGSGKQIPLTYANFTNSTEEETVLQNEVMWDEPAVKKLYIFK